MTSQVARWWEAWEKQYWKSGHEEPLCGGKKEVLSEYTQTWAVFLSHVGTQKDSSFKKKNLKIK